MRFRVDSTVIISGPRDDEARGVYIPSGFSSAVTLLYRASAVRIL